MIAAADTGLHLFDTAIGVCGVAWNAVGLVGVQLPESSPAATRRRLEARFPTLAAGPPDAATAAAIDRMIALLGGARDGLDDVRIDTAQVAGFAAQVYALARAVPPGRTTTYGDLARALGDVGLARAVGQALGANPWPIVVPCHRVLGAAGMGGFSARGGVATKQRMLEIEGAAGLQLGLF